MGWFLFGFIVGFIICLFMLNDKFAKIENENNKLRKENKRLNRLV